MFGCGGLSGWPTAPALAWKNHGNHENHGKGSRPWELNPALRHVMREFLTTTTLTHKGVCSPWRHFCTTFSFTQSVDAVATKPPY